MEEVAKTIYRDGEAVAKIDFRQRLAPITQKQIQEYVGSKGKKYTLLKLIEEMNELSKEILKDVNCGEKDLDAILEELGDVVLHISCAQEIYNFSPAQIHNRIAYKVLKRKQKGAKKSDSSI